MLLQLAFAGILSIAYALVMMIVIVGLILEMKKDGICAPTTIFMIFVVGVFVVSAIMHPTEFYCLFHGVLYLLAIPAMSMLLIIYSICNLNVVSWGTREVSVFILFLFGFVFVLVAFGGEGKGSVFWEYSMRH